MEFKPHNYQQMCIQWILDIPKCGLFLDMGLGKTVTTLTAVKELKFNRFAVRRVLVIAPKKVAEGTWSREAGKWDHTKMMRVSRVLGPLQKRIRALNTPADLYIINRENVVWLVDYYRNDWPFDMVVVDESSSFKSHAAQRFKALASVYSKIRRMVLLTGTPSPNGLQDLWAQIYLLDEGQRLGKYITHFKTKYFYQNSGGYGCYIKPGSEESILGAIKDICVSLEAKDYLELPEIVYHPITVELDTKARKAYNELERHMILELSESDGDITVTSAAALSNKLLQLSNGAVYDAEKEWHKIHDCKIEAFMELMESLQGKPALVFYNFKSDLDRLQEALKKTKLRVRLLKKPEDEDDWNTGKIDVLLAHPASAAYGLNLQDGGNHVIWFGLTWNYELYAQANKRLHRQGQKERVFIHILTCEDTRDEDVAKALEAKGDVQGAVMESLKARIREVRESVRRSAR